MLSFTRSRRQENVMKKVKTTIAAIGVDRGGTWTRAVALDASGKPLRSARFKTCPLRSLPKKLCALLSGWPGGTLAPLGIATRGAFSKPWKRAFLYKALGGKLNLKNVISDAEAAHYAAFGGKAGLLLIAGTGAVVFSGRPGAFIKTGGHNPASGDPGSGRWLGRQYLKLRGRLREAGAMGHGPSAAYAKNLLRLALGGRAEAAELTARAQEELAALLKSAAPGRGPVKTALAGGLMNDLYFRAGFVSAARRELGGRRLVFVQAAITAEEAAARLALPAKRKAR
jgi:N-acetylglucosamine kinase-like BadF-type ATPase